jgi:hypothetical protein
MDWQNWQMQQKLTDLDLSELLMLADPQGRGITERSIRNLRSGHPGCLRTALLFMRISEGAIDPTTFDRWGIFDG